MLFRSSTSVLAACGKRSPVDSGADFGGGIFIRGRPIAELAMVIVAPAPERAVCLEPTGVGTARGQRNPLKSGGSFGWDIYILGRPVTELAE